MPKINILPKNTAELIAAGEVVERPASVVKELIENSVDAGAKKITVEISGGGTRFIRITDNGCGIAREDVRTAFISHATSKIKSIEDLYSIHTMGFRGEALPSIAAVSRVEVLTKSPEESVGTRYCLEGGEEKIFDDAGCPDGTTIVVSDIFYNTPARMKFLKKDNTEGNYVTDVVSKASLAHPDVSYRLIKDGKQTLFTSGDGNLKNAISAVYGKEFSSGLIPCSYSLNGIEIDGFVSKPLNCRANRNMQHFFVNRRCVRIPVASAALDEAYRNSSMVGKFPSCVLMLKIAPQTLDVNVHPAKTEVRFSDEKRIFDIIFYSAKSAIQQGDTRPEFTFGKTASSNFNPPQRSEQFFIHIPASEYGNTVPSVKQVYEEKNPQTQAVSKTEYKPFVTGDVLTKEILTREFSDDEDEKINPQELLQSVVPNTRSEAEIEPIQTNIPAIPLNESVIPLDESIIPSEEPVIPSNEPVISSDEKDKPKPVKIISEVFNTYIICEYENKLLLIDKHALHERILYNELKSRPRENISQLLISPVTVILSAKEYDAVISNRDIFSSAGFGIEDFGDGSVIVRECPVMLMDEDVPGMITEMAGKLLGSIREPTPDRLDEIFHSMACRAAVKAGSQLNKDELADLVGRFLSDDSLRYCPHGRPVLIEMSRYEIEKQFGRAGAI